MSFLRDPLVHRSYNGTGGNHGQKEKEQDGDILHPGIVEVQADSVKDAIEKAEAGEFAISDEQHDCLGFKFTGGIMDKDDNEINE